jgi:light-regulated signal transduction histidine kinase (bacteriophytochrome)
MPYHVTSKQVGQKIWNTQTIDINEQINKNRTRRKKMREEIDEKANKKYADWVNRSEAVFAWATFEKATQYAKKFQEPAIVEFDISGTAWCAESFLVEYLHHEYSDQLDDKLIIQLIEQARKWNGEHNEEIEIWFKPKSVNQIYSVTDEYGNPL